MKISNEILKLLHDQISIEGSASTFYLSAASWCNVNGYEVSANFFRGLSQEEWEHMIKIIDYLNDLKIHAIIPKFEKPSHNMKSLEELCKTTLQKEHKVTKSINEMVSIAQKEHDHKTNTFLE